MVLTAEKVKRRMALMSRISDYIRTRSEVPNAVLHQRFIDGKELFEGYSLTLMGLSSYESAINLLIRAKLVRRDPGHLLVWIGPK